MRSTYYLHFISTFPTYLYILFLNLYVYSSIPVLRMLFVFRTLELFLLYKNHLRAMVLKLSSIFSSKILGLLKSLFFDFLQLILIHTVSFVIALVGQGSLPTRTIIMSFMFTPLVHFHETIDAYYILAVLMVVPVLCQQARLILYVFTNSFCLSFYHFFVSEGIQKTFNWKGVLQSYEPWSNCHEVPLQEDFDRGRNS